MRAYSHMKNNRHTKVSLLSLAICCCAVFLFAPSACLAEKPELSYDFTGYVGLQGGQIVQGQYKNHTLIKRWQEKVLGGFNLSATVNERLKVIFAPECIITQAVYDNSAETGYSADIESMHGYYFFYLNEMSGTYSWGDVENPFLQCKVGYFRYTYNQDIKSLGEYLFRATAYPGYIINDFASVYKRLPGLLLHSNPVQNLNIDFLLTSELQAPVGDWTPSLLADYGIGGEEGHPMLDIGGGASYTRLISVDQSLTFPHTNENLGIRYDTIHLADHDSLITMDSLYYTFQALKVMARFSFDMKQLFGNPDFFGSEDLKLYGEGCVLGTQNYAIFYDDIMRRIPVMFGFNFPTFKIMDVLSLEVEWYNHKYSNNYENTYFPRNKTPLPLVTGEPPTDPLYWSVYAKKTITQGIQILGEVGRNHYFTQAKYPQYQDRRESMPNHGDWQYVFRIQYSF
jgi:hypothetical protein